MTEDPSVASDFPLRWVAEKSRQGKLRPQLPFFESSLSSLLLLFIEYANCETIGKVAIVASGRKVVDAGCTRFFHSQGQTVNVNYSRSIVPNPFLGR